MRIKTKNPSKEEMPAQRLFCLRLAQVAFKPSISVSMTLCALLGIKPGLPTANRTAMINTIETTHVVNIAFVSGKLKILPIS